MAEPLVFTAAGALAVKPVLLAPVETVTDGGTATAGLPLLSATLVALVAAALRLTVQEAVPGGVRLAGVHVRFESAGGAAGAFNVSVKVLEVPLMVAVTTAEPLTLTAVGAFAVKPALLAPAETVTEGGTVTDALPLVSATLVELVTAAVRATMQDDVAGGVKLAGVHVTLDSVGVTVGLFNVSVKVLEVPLKVAVITAEPLTLTAVGAFAVKPALLAPAETLTEGGTVTEALPLVSATLVELATAPVRATVQDDVAGGVKLAGVHVTLDSVGVTVGLFNVSVKVLEVPLKVAVITAEPLTLTAVGAFAVNPAVLAPAETVTEGGTVTEALPLVSATLVELATAPVRATVQDDVAGGVKLAGVQLTLDNVGVGWLIVIVAPVPVALIDAPLPSVAERPDSETKDEEFVVPAEICRVMVARTPLPIAVVLKPATIHRISPGAVRLHEAAFPAAVAAAPVT